LPDLKNTEEIISHYKKVIFPLESLVKVANASTGSKMSITINVKGITISGYLVALDEFHEYTSDTILENVRKVSDAETFQNMQTIMNAMKDMYAKPELRDLVNSYVCIKNPSYHIYAIDGKDKYTIEGSFWIGKIESVDGFTIGMPD
jgi:hypothetical protein